MFRKSLARYFEAQIGAIFFENRQIGMVDKRRKSTKSASQTSVLKRFELVISMSQKYMKFHGFEAFFDQNDQKAFPKHRFQIVLCMWEMLL